MLSRREVKQQVNAMQADIRRKASESALSSQEMLPSVRELALNYGISRTSAAESLKALIDEGVLYSVPRVGIFFGHPKSEQRGSYLLLLQEPEINTHCQTVQLGFEERIVQLGGTCLTLESHTAHQWFDAGQLPPILGVFDFDENKLEQRFWGEGLIEAPLVKFSESQNGEVDTVYFDNFRGGQQATQHLLDMGHQQIAFVGLHGQQDEPGAFIWSKEREEGWQMTLENTGHSTKGLSFQPELTPDIAYPSQIKAAREAATKLLRDSKTSAIVATNRYAAQGIFEAIRASNLPSEHWPALVCFDTSNFEGGEQTAHLTALRLPWDDIGRTAADILWERSNNQLESEPQQRLVPMRLIRRLTCRRNWAQSSGAFESNKLPAKTVATAA